MHKTFTDKVTATDTLKIFITAGTLEFEPTCGHPLGMRFDKNGTNLIVADAFFGLLEVNPETKAVRTLLPPTPGFKGKPFQFANHLDIDEDGTFYFTHSSTKWQRHQAPYSFLNRR